MIFHKNNKLICGYGDGYISIFYFSFMRNIDSIDLEVI
jgi:hypothetical protein